jgi:chromosome segregation ATPase
MPSILDFSSAYPWLGSGFVAGLFIYWLLRTLFSGDRRRNAELLEARSELTEARRSMGELSNKASSLESEWARLTNEVGQLQPRAALVPQYERQMADVKQADTARQTQLDTAMKQLAALQESSAAEIASLRQDVETHGGSAKYYEAEFNRLFAEHETASKNALSISSDLQKSKASLEAASRDAGDSVRLRSELASAKAENDSLRADLEQRKAAETKQVAAQAQASSANETKLKAELETAKADIVALRADLEQRRGSESGHGEVLTRLTSEYEAKQKSAAAEYATLAAESRKNAEEVTHLKARLSAAPAATNDGAEIARLKDEAAKLAAALEAAKTAERAAAMEHHANKNDLLQVRTALEETSRIVAERHGEIEQLKAKLAAMPADIENYRRFKDALDAANRIAAGLPDKS